MPSTSQRASERGREGDPSNITSTRVHHYSLDPSRSFDPSPWTKNRSWTLQNSASPWLELLSFHSECLEYCIFFFFFFYFLLARRSTVSLVAHCSLSDLSRGPAFARKLPVQMQQKNLRDKRMRERESERECQARSINFELTLYSALKITEKKTFFSFADCQCCFGSYCSNCKCCEWS